MTHNYEVILVWGERLRTVKEYSIDFYKLLQLWGISSKYPEKWYSEDPRINGEVMLKDALVIEDLLRIGRQEWEHGTQHFDAFQLPFSNGAPGLTQVNGGLLCGITQPSKGMWFPNCLRFKLWGGDQVGCATLGRLESMLRSGAAVFDPDWGSVTVKGIPQMELSKAMSGYPFVAWKTYFSERFGPAPAGGISFGNGVLFSAVDGWFDPKNPDHLRQREALVRKLHQVGWLRPSTQPLDNAP